MTIMHGLLASNYKWETNWPDAHRSTSRPDCISHNTAVPELHITCTRSPLQMHIAHILMHVVRWVLRVNIKWFISRQTCFACSLKEKQSVALAMQSELWYEVNKDTYTKKSINQEVTDEKIKDSSLVTIDLQIISFFFISKIVILKKEKEKKR